MDKGSTTQAAELLDEAIEAFERGDAARVDAICRENPGEAERIRASLFALAEIRGPKLPVELRPPQSRHERPQRIGRFLILAELGRGAVGVVYLARDPDLGRNVAVKLLAALPTPEALERFRRETRATAKLQHPSIAAIHEVGETEQGLPYFVMDFVDGRSLEAILSELDGIEARELTAERLLPFVDKAAASSYVTAVVRVGARLADSLDHAHRAGVVHRDVKPGNVLLDRAGDPHLVDFGLAFGGGDLTVTRTGSSVGTPLYMAPEQIRGGRAEIGPATDVYALGATLYRALARRPPFDGETTQQIFDRIERAEPLPLRRANPNVSRDLEIVIGKALEKDPRRRYASAAELRDDLQALLDLRPIRARPASAVTRTVKWVRRNRLKTVAALGVGLGAASLLGWTVFEQRDAALRAWRDYQDEVRELDRLELTLEQERSTLTGHVAESDRIRISALENDVDGKRLAHEQRLFAAEAALSRALVWSSWFEFLDSDVRHALLDAKFESRRLAKDRRLVLRMEQLESEIESLTSGRRGFEEAMLGKVQLATGLTGAELHLFRYLDRTSLRKGSIPRLVPVPVDSSSNPTREHLGDFQPGDLCLVVLDVDRNGVASRTGLRAGDLILGIGAIPLRDGGVFVRSVAARGSAELAGVRPFDRILSVNGHPAGRAIGCLWDWMSVPWMPPPGWSAGYGVLPDEPLDCLVRTSRGLSVWIRSALAGIGPYESEAHPRAVMPTVAWQGRKERRGPDVAATTLDDALGVAIVAPAGLFDSPAAGDVELSVLAGGRVRSIELHAGERLGARVLSTACPLVFSETNRVSADAPGLWTLKLRTGSYLSVLRSPGCFDVRRPFAVEPSERLEIEVGNPPATTPPEGFVWIPACAFGFQGDPFVSFDEPRRQIEVSGFFISRCEVTLGAWLEFMNAQMERKSPSDVDQEDAPHGRSPKPWHVSLSQEGSWTHGVQVVPMSPVVGVDDSQIVRFLEWKNAQAEEGRDPWRYRLPTEAEWELAARGLDGRAFPWGNCFEFTLCNSYFARDALPKDLGWLEPVGSFLTDESPFGVLDMGGSAAEYNSGNLRPSLAHWPAIRGGSWRGVSASAFRAASRNSSEGSFPDRGFRLVAMPAQ